MDDTDKYAGKYFISQYFIVFLSMVCGTWMSNNRPLFYLHLILLHALQWRMGSIVIHSVDLNRNLYFELIKDFPNLIAAGELWSIYCIYLEKTNHFREQSMFAPNQWET